MQMHKFILKMGNSEIHYTVLNYMLIIINDICIYTDEGTHYCAHVHIAIFILKYHKPTH